MTANTAAATGLALRPPAVLADPWLRRLVTTIVAAMTGVVVIVAVLAFLASFGAIHDFALRSGGYRSGACVDGAVVRGLVCVHRLVR